MKNYLLFPDCFSADSIHQCRFAILKFLGVYNLTPPANISVIIYTSKAAAFEIFVPFFKSVNIVETASALEWTTLALLQQSLAGIDGNVLLCRSHGYINQPVEPMLQQVGNGFLCYCLPEGSAANDQPDQIFANAFSFGISTTRLYELTSPHTLPVKESKAQFVVYNNRKKLNALLQRFFQKNEEESLSTQVKKARGIDLAAAEKEACDLEKLPLLRRWLLQWRRKNNLLRQYRNKL